MSQFVTGKKTPASRFASGLRAFSAKSRPMAQYAAQSMAGFRGSDGGLFLLLSLLASTGCSSPQAVTPGDGSLPSAELRIGDDPFVASLATEFSRALPQVAIRRTAVTSAAGWGAIQRNEVDLALAPANNAYF